MSCLRDIEVFSRQVVIWVWSLRVKEAFEEDWLSTAGWSDMLGVMTGPMFLSIGNRFSNTWHTACFPFSPHRSIYLSISPLCSTSQQAVRDGLRQAFLALWLLMAFGLDCMLEPLPGCLLLSYSSSAAFWQLFHYLVPFSLEVLTALCWWSTLP